MRTVALARKHTRVLDAVAAIEATGDTPSVATIAERIPLRPDLVETLATDLSARGLLSCSGEFRIDDDPLLPGPEFRVTSDGHRALTDTLVPAR